MEFFYNVDVTNVNVIVQKEETPDFKFYNPKRSGDGFVCFLSGNGQVKINGQDKQETKKGSFVLLKKGDEYEFTFPCPCSYVTSEMEMKNWDSVFSRIVNLDEDEINDIITINKIYNEMDEFSLVESKIALLKFFTKVARRIKNEQPCIDAVKLAVAFLHKNYDCAFSLQDVATYCSVSESYLRKTFKNSTGLTVMEYREEIRIKKAKELLSSGVFKIKEIADKLGYCDVYHFSKNFKLYTKTTPAKFIKLK